MILLDRVLLSAYPEVNPVRNFIGVFNPVGIILKCVQLQPPAQAPPQRGFFPGGRASSPEGVAGYHF
jgi:hypothetical protein